MSQHRNKTFVRWAGGKQDLAAKITKKLLSSPSCNAYHEPFCGAGSIFFNLNGQAPAHLSDVNAELINALIAIRDFPHDLMRELDQLDSMKSKEGFLEIRGWDREPCFLSIPPLKRAARFIFLQKLGFNGLWRENKKGQYNTSYGNDDSKSLYDNEIILSCSQSLTNTKIAHQSFDESIRNVKKGDLVYLDPPYIPVTKSAFNYNAKGFSMEDQERLEELLCHIDSIGAYFVLSNSYCKATRSLYSNHICKRIMTRRNISRNAAGRKTTAEILVSNF